MKQEFWKVSQAVETFVMSITSHNKLEIPSGKEADKRK
jgi:hypothetical protein